MSDFLAYAELESEWNARFDYIAELRAEHAENYDGEDELQRELETWDQVGALTRDVDFRSCGNRRAWLNAGEWEYPFLDARALVVYDADDDIPF